ncbi:MAG: flagellar basal body L-ring protein FlgH [Ignavibacterium sp.]|jgi:flagellar L-ring protein precursor FlgH|nr:flagellar basal body L-ring protein FlgH [Ignavibacterium sp.]
MKKIFLVLMLTTVVSYSQNMRQNSFYSLFSDQKAAYVGDAITIIVVESSLATNKAKTTSGKESDLSFDLGGKVLKNDVPEINVGINSGNKFSGAGSTEASGVIQTKISATIDSVLNNGNLVIRGSKKIVINGEEQLINIKGIVRTSDVRADNSVLSYNISDSEITFEGSGLIDDAQSPGWLTKFLHWIF